MPDLVWPNVATGFNPYDNTGLFFNLYGGEAMGEGVMEFNNTGMINFDNDFQNYMWSIPFNFNNCMKWQ